MKTTLQLLALAAIIFLTSCGTSNVLVLKRKYTKGYYVDFGNKKNNKNSEIKENKANTAIATKENFETNIEQEVAQEETVNAPLTASADNKIVLPSTNNKISMLHTHISEQASSIENHKLKSAKTESKLISRINKKINKSKSNAKSSGNSNLILLVILSLFPILSLIAMYLHDGHAITLNFWIDLLLHFTIVGYAIFALLVVFDIINLA